MSSSEGRCASPTLGRRHTNQRSTSHNHQINTLMSSTTLDSIQRAHTPLMQATTRITDTSTENKHNKAAEQPSTSQTQMRCLSTHLCCLGTRRALGVHHVKLTCFERELQLYWRFTNSMTQIIGARTDCEWPAVAPQVIITVVVINISHVTVMQGKFD